MKKNKFHDLSFATFVFGSYQKYIPYYIYSTAKTYPEAIIKVFIEEPLNSKIKKAVKLLEKAGYKSEIIKPNLPIDFYENFKLEGGKGQTGKTARWMINQKYFDDTKYCYIGDVDFIHLPEKIHLVEFHKKNMDFFNLPFSNQIRVDDTGKPNGRLTGCHFFETKKYYSGINPVLDKLQTDKKFRTQFLKGLKRNEHFLYKINKIVFDFNDMALSKSNRIWHGVHIGISRGNKNVNMNVLEKNTSLSLKETRNFLIEFSEDKLFKQLQKLVYVLELDVILEKLDVPRPLNWKINRIKNRFQEGTKEVKKKIRNVIGS